MKQSPKPIVVAIFADFPLSFFDSGGLGRGGGQQSTWLPQLAEAWKDSEGVEIHWCLRDRTIRKRVTVRHWGQTFHQIPDRGVSIGLLAGRWPQRLEHRKVLREIQPDLIHCWGTETLYGAALWEYAALDCLDAGGDHHLHEDRDLQDWRWRLFRFWEPKTLRKAVVVTCESKWGLIRSPRSFQGRRSGRLNTEFFRATMKSIGNRILRNREYCSSEV